MTEELGFIPGQDEPSARGHGALPMPPEARVREVLRMLVDAVQRCRSAPISARTDEELYVALTIAHHELAHPAKRPADDGAERATAIQHDMNQKGPSA